MRSKAAIRSHPIHPMLVAFPIGLFITSLIFDVLGTQRGIPALWSAGFYCVIAGLCFSVAAAVPGVIDLFAVVPPNSSGRNRGYKHALLNLAMIAVFIAGAAHRGDAATQPDGMSLVLSAVGVGLLIAAGWLGATLVYRNQIGVDHLFANAGVNRTVVVERWDAPVCAESDLKEGQLLLAEIAGARIAVGRCGEGFAAFSDRCTHKGGPLSDGALVGCTVQCPWHGSQFNVHTGRVVNGPAEERIEAYDVEISDGKVFVRPKRSRAEEKPQAA